MNTDIDSLLTSLADQTQTYLDGIGDQSPLIVGIRTGGIWVAEYLHRSLNLSNTIGILDISFYRDDFSRLGLNPQVRPSQLQIRILS